MAILQSDLQSSHEAPIETAPISSQGVRAVDLLLDPEADLDQDPDGPGGSGFNLSDALAVLFPPWSRVRGR